MALTFHFMCQISRKSAQVFGLGERLKKFKDTHTQTHRHTPGASSDSLLCVKNILSFNE